MACMQEYGGARCSYARGDVKGLAIFMECSNTLGLATHPLLSMNGARISMNKRSIFLMAGLIVEILVMLFSVYNAV